MRHVTIKDYKCVWVEAGFLVKDQANIEISGVESSIWEIKNNVGTGIGMRRSDFSRFDKVVCGYDDRKVFSCQVASFYRFFFRFRGFCGAMIS